jgi:hypothetical protein
VVARVRLTGTTAAHGTLTRQADLVALAREQVTATALLAGVEVATRPRLDRSQVLARDNLQSDILHTLDAATDPVATLLELVGDQLTKQAHSRLQEQLTADPTLAGALLTRVETLLTELLEDPS